MEATIKSKFASEEILEKRKQMIKSEKLHIKDELSKYEFKNLYYKYGSGISEKNFAWSFLDIDEVKYYNLEKEKITSTTILLYEYISNEEFGDIRKQLIKAYNIKHGEKISHEEILEMYNKFGDRLYIGLFLKEILGIKRNTIGNIKTGDIRNEKINFDINPGEYNTFHKNKSVIPMHILNPDYIYELRKKLLLEEHLHVGDSISYEQLQKFNEEYCSEMPEIIFAQKVIGIGSNSYKDIKRNKLENSINELIFQDVDIPNKYTEQITNKIIELYNLKADQLLKREEFQELYDKYGGILSRKLFAILVLEMSHKSYNLTIKEKLYKSATILDSKEKTDFNTTSERIIKKESLHHGDMLKYEEFERIHKLYGPNLPEIIFAENVLGITSKSFENMKYHGSRLRINLKLPDKFRFNWFKREVRFEEGLHINDEINYNQVVRLYKKRGGILSLKMFALEVLGLNERSFLRIKKYKNKKAFLLFNIQMSNYDIQKIRRMVILEKNLQRPRKLSMEEIKELYSLYGSIMSPIMFVRDMLGISVKSLYELSNKKIDETLACVRADFNDIELAILKEYLAEGLSDIKIAMKMGVTVTFLCRNKNNLLDIREVTKNNFLYKKVKSLINKGKSPEEIAEKLGILKEYLKDMFDLYKREKEEEKIPAIEKNAIEAVNGYEYNDKIIEDVREYIEECRKTFEKRKFLKKDLYFLEECMIFVQCNFREIELFSKMCIYFNEKKMAIDFISENIDNEDIKLEEKIKLNNLRKNIGDIIKKENALEMLRIGTMTPQEVSRTTGVLESDVIKLQKELNKRITFMMKEDSNIEEDD